MNLLEKLKPSGMRAQQVLVFHADGESNGDLETPQSSFEYVTDG